MYNLKKIDFETFKKKNLAIRHNIADILPFLSDSDLKKYQDFFKYSENLEKRVFYTAGSED